MAEYCYSVQQTTDGGYVAAGRTYSCDNCGGDVSLLKTNELGELEWMSNFGGSKSDLGKYVRQTFDGGYIVTGYTCSYGLGASDIYLVKTDSTGVEEWSRTIGGDGTERSYCIQQTADSGYVAIGETDSWGNGGFDVYLLRMDREGEELWARTFGGSLDDWGKSIALCSDGGFAITGKTLSEGAGGWDVYVIKTDSLGNEEWSRTFGAGDDDFGKCIKETSDGGLVIAGYTKLNSRRESDIFLIRTDYSGVLLWSNILQCQKEAYAYSIVQTDDKGYAIAGYTYAWGEDQSDIFLMKTDLRGTLRWTRIFGGDDDEKGKSIQLTSDGGYMIAGRTQSYGEGGGDFYLIKTNSSGGLK